MHHTILHLERIWGGQKGSGSGPVADGRGSRSRGALRRACRGRFRWKSRTARRRRAAAVVAVRPGAHFTNGVVLQASDREMSREARLNVNFVGLEPPIIGVDALFTTVASVKRGRCSWKARARCKTCGRGGDGARRRIVRREESSSSWGRNGDFGKSSFRRGVPTNKTKGRGEIAGSITCGEEKNRQKARGKSSSC